MATVSLCMIVKNEEAILAQILDIASTMVEEIIIVDTGSDDGTKEIAGRYTPWVYDYPWQDDFAAARNASMAKATCDYVMWLDADDWLEPEAVEKFVQYKQQLTEEVDVVMMPYQTAFDQQGQCTFWYQRERLFRRELGLQFQGRVHEVVVPCGAIVTWEVPVRHAKPPSAYSRRNLHIYQQMEHSGHSFSPRDCYYYGREWLSHGEQDMAILWLERCLTQPQLWPPDQVEASVMLAQLYQQTQPEKALTVLLSALGYSGPQAKLCVALGNYYRQREQYQEAIFWYEGAMGLPVAQEGFVDMDDYGYLPAMWLVVCYDRLGNTQRAYHYHQIAASKKPYDGAVQYNQDYFANKHI